MFTHITNNQRLCGFKTTFEREHFFDQKHRILGKTILAKLFSWIPKYFSFSPKLFCSSQIVFSFSKNRFLRISAIRQIRAGVFGHPQNVGYVLKFGPIELIFGAIGTEFRGEADSGTRLAPQCDFHAYSKKFGYLVWKPKQPATWPE